MLFLLTTWTRCLELPEYWVPLCTHFLAVSNVKPVCSKVILGISFAYDLVALFAYPVPTFLCSLQPICITHKTCPAVYSPFVHHMHFRCTVFVPNVSFCSFSGLHMLLNPERADLSLSRGSCDQHQLFCCPFPASSLLQDVCGI